MNMNNVPVIKVGIVAVSRDCFPESLAVNRRKAVIAKYEEKFGKEGIYECPITIVESEIHAQQALEDVKRPAVTPSAFTWATSVLRSLRP